MHSQVSHNFVMIHLKEPISKLKIRILIPKFDLSRGQSKDILEVEKQSFCLSEKLECRYLNSQVVVLTEVSVR